MNIYINIFVIHATYTLNMCKPVSIYEKSIAFDMQRQICVLIKSDQMVIMWVWLEVWGLIPCVMKGGRPYSTMQGGQGVKLQGSYMST